MSQRFDGAVTTPDDEIPDSSIVPAVERPARPVLVELGAAILIVGGITAIMGWVVAQMIMPNIPADAGLLPVIILGLNGVTIAIGVLMRQGRLWRLCVNVVAVAIFLYLTAAPNPIAVFYMALDTVAFFALVRHRQWFEWKPSEASTGS